MKLKHLWMVPAISLAASTSSFSQAVADVPAADKVNKEAEDFEASKADVMLKQLADMMQKGAKKDGKDIDAKEILNILGLGAVDSYAYSSDKQGEEYVNLMYLHDNGANKGIFKLLGGESVKYSVPTMCPKGTDLAAQLKLNLGNAEEMIRGIMKAGKAPDEDMEEFEDGMNEDVPNMDMNVSTMLKKIDVTVHLAIDMDPAEKLQLPFPGMPAVDKPRIVARIDNMKWAWPSLDKELQDPQTGLQRSEKDGVIVYRVAEEMEMMLMGYSPLLVMDTNTNQLWFATSQAFLKRCKSGENTLADDENFQATMKDLPKKGNAMFYMSSDLAKFIVSIMEEQIKEGNMEKNEETQKMLAYFKGIKTGAVQAYTRDETGAHISARSAESLKDSVTEMKKAIDELMQELQ